MENPRKIVHIDMDAFYASVEQRDQPRLRGRPVVVGGSPYSRGVVAACSYEARAFGIRSAMPSRQALALCRDTVFVDPRFEVYREVSLQIQSIFTQYTELVEPLSLDEAYLDVTDCPRFEGSASRIAHAIKAEILKTTGLIASAGVSYNKFLAKIASDMDKPDGFCCVLPEQGEAFVATLPIGKFYGVGAVTEARMLALGIENGSDLRRWTLDDLRAHFGKSADFYYHIARGIDERSVSSDRTRKSIGSETTFSKNLLARDAMLEALDLLAIQVGESLQAKSLLAGTVTLKARFPDFTTVSRSITLPDLVGDAALLSSVIPVLLERAVDPGREVRLLGLSVSGLVSDDIRPRQLGMFNDP